MLRLVICAALLVAVYSQQIQPSVPIGTSTALRQTIAVRGRTNASCQITCSGGGICVKEKNCNDQQYSIGCYFCVDPNTLPCLTRNQINEVMLSLISQQNRGQQPVPRGNENRGGGLFSSDRPLTSMLLMDGLGFF